MNVDKIMSYASAAIILAIVAFLTDRAVAANQVPVEVRRIGAAPAPAPSQGNYYPIIGQHTSRTVSTYEDHAGNQPWHIRLRWRGCPVTPAGSLTFTIYKDPISEDPPGGFSAYPSGHRTLWSQTVEEHTPSGSGVYEFAGRDETFFFVKVKVPSKRGCRDWDFSGETN